MKIKWCRTCGATTQHDAEGFCIRCDGKVIVDDFDRVLGALKEHGPMTSDKVATECKLSVGRARDILRTLRRSGRVSTVAGTSNVKWRAVS